ncbi:MFS transporter [Actinoplanes derwentensis]|uniref:MFS transporter, DHA1 family, L-arabinose/isopropyl-beta-D-thiogalactopyranoside export protein n=1 Tax=Actinoplanes derwentensis TaxID=113562 RepID=A0A1H1Z0G8_9ACTN|nr:MFS transporter [Actinoplanes derwentensis]GID81375.1 MFS transporter [Actinoplanes derwentensis]SDT27295.1 MFS transporter, DHA1 family, L-arabinose/isopropyl-beta-D-thiogalactopyranoside export protein [Actinoplanes derwentensis]
MSGTPTNARNVAALGALMLAAFCYLTVEVLPVGLLPVIAEDLGVSLSAVGMLVTGYGLTVAIFSLPLTRLLRGVPRRHLITGLLIVFVVSTAVTVTGGGYPVLLGGRVVTALSQSVFWAVAAPAATALFAPRLRGRAVAAVFGGSSLAPVLGVPAATWLGQQAGWRVAFLAVAGLALVATAGVALLLPTSSPGAGHAAVGSAPDPRSFRLLLVVVAITITGVFTAYTYLTPYLTEVAGFAAGSVSFILMAYGVAGLGGVAVAGYLSDRAPRTSVLLPVGLLAVISLGLWLAAHQQAAVIVLVSLWGFALPQVPSAFQSRVLVIAPGATDMASAMLSSAFNLGIAGGAALGGALLPHGGVRGDYLIGGLLVAVAFAVLAIFSRPVRGTALAPVTAVEKDVPGESRRPWP